MNNYYQSLILYLDSINISKFYSQSYPKASFFKIENANTITKYKIHDFTIFIIWNTIIFIYLHNNNSLRYCFFSPFQLKKKKRRNKKEKNFNSKIRIINAPPTTSSYIPPLQPPLFFDFPLNPWSARITKQFRRDINSL